MEARLAQLQPLIEELFELSGSPGMSFGVLHQGDPIYTAHFGRRRASQATPPNDDTLFNVASITKLMTAGVVSNLVEQGLVGWDVPVRHYLPEFGERKDEVGQYATLEDLLANRTGLSAQNTFWGTMFEDILPDREQIPRMACHIPTIGEFRKTFVYSSWGYALVTSAIERVTSQSFSTCVEKYIFAPLGMNRSTTNLPTVDNVVYKHWVGLDSIGHEFPWSEYRGWCDDTGFGGAVGGRSSTKELLIMYQSLLHAYDHQKRNDVDSTPGSPFKYVRRILSSHIGVGNASAEQQGYCLGTYRTQLPGNLSFASYNSILLGKKNSLPFGTANEGRAVFHQVASFTGYNGSMLLDPQSKSAIFVLVNSLPLFDITDMLGKLLLGTILGEQNQKDHIKLAKSVKKTNMVLYDAYKAGLEAKKTEKSPSFPLKDYEGDYWNETKIMCYMVHAHGDRQLRVQAKGSSLTNYVLEPLGGNVFYLPPNREVELSQSMWPFTSLKSRIFKFNCSEDKVLNFSWHHDITPGTKPETFSKEAENLHSKL
ncbi:beta-lactamase/transpeptidase-like protein [Phaeosphaeriaceae sp. PMI808]|nr:beta-lactamase/transpeptidase-like protein [Phaeosphaeriaceae sp. PMI808]